MSGMDHITNPRDFVPFASAHLTMKENDLAGAHSLNVRTAGQALNEFEAGRDIGLASSSLSAAGPSSLEPHSIPLEVAKAAQARANCANDTALPKNETNSTNSTLRFPHRKRATARCM